MYLHNIYNRVWVYFSRNRCDWLQGGWTGKKRGCDKKRVDGIYKNFYLSGKVVNKWKLVKWVAIFPKNWYFPTTTIRLHWVTNLKTCLSAFNFLPVSFFHLPLWILWTKLKNILNLNQKKWNTGSQICKLHLIFYQHLY